jgi:hypothetical protein
MLNTSRGGCSVKRVLDSGGSAELWAHPRPARATKRGCFFRDAAAVRAVIKHTLADVLVSAHSLASCCSEFPSDSRVCSSSLKRRARQSKIFLFDPLFDAPARFITKAAA